MKDDANSKYIEHFGQKGSSTFSPNLQKLLEEHAPLLLEIETLLNHVDAFAGSDKEWTELVIKHQTFVANLEHHSEKEERTLFKFMKDHIGTTSGPIEIMEEEHEEINNQLNFFSSFVKNEVQGVPNDDEIPELLGFLQNAFDVMQQHFFKEEHAIYPMAEDMLSQEEKDKVGSWV